MDQAHPLGRLTFRSDDKLPRRGRLTLRTVTAGLLVALVGSFLVLPAEPAAALVDPSAVPTAVVGTGAAATGATVCVTTVVCAAGVAVAIAAVGISIGTYTTLSWLDPGDDPPGVESSIGVQSTGVVDCPSYVSSAGNKCFRVSAAALPFLNPGYSDAPSISAVNGFAIVGQSPVSTSYVPFRTQSGDPTYYGDSAFGSFPEDASGNLYKWFVIPSGQASTPTFGLKPAQAAQFRAYRNQFTGPVIGSTVYGATRLDDNVDTTGLRRRLRTTRTCVGPTTTDTLVSYSAEFWDRDAKDVPIPVPECAPGRRTQFVSVYKVTIGGPSYVPAIGDKAIWSWTAPAVAPALQPTVDRCLGSGADCDLVSTPATATEPETCVWGGDTVPLSWCSDTQLLPAPSTGVESSTTTVSPQPTTLPSTSTTTTTAVVTGDPPPPPPPGDPLFPPDDEDDTFSSCLDDRTAGLGTSPVGWNVGSWIKRVVQYIAAPVFCALYWFFVPAGGWSSLVDGFVEIWETSPILGPLRNLFQIAGTTQCLPVNLDAPPILDDVDVDVGVCGNDAIAALWALIIGFGVYGLINDVLTTVADFRRKRDAGAFT